MNISYPATVQRQDDGRYFVQFVDMPDTFTEGQTEKEALFNAAEVLLAMLSWRLDEAKDVPAPNTATEGTRSITLKSVARFST
jgi:antitoxin HicB